MKKTAFPKNGDTWLFILAIAVLVSFLLYQGWKRYIIQPAVPAMVLTHCLKDDPEKGILFALTGEFDDLHGDINITVTGKPYDDFRNELFSPGGFSGDLLIMDHLWVPELLEKGVIESAEDPFFSFINVLFYNVDILKEAGFSRPPKNRTEFLNYARAVGRNHMVRGLAINLNGSRGIYDDIYPWIWASGAQLITDGNVTVNSRQVVESLSFLSSLNSEGLILAGGDKPENFISGKAAFMIAPAGNIGYARERMGSEAFGVTSVPQPDNYQGRPIFAASSWTAGVLSSSKRKEEARLFMDLIKGKNAFPSESAGPLNDPFFSKVRDIRISGEDARDFDGLIGEYELEEIFREELAVLFSGQFSPVDAAAAIQKKWEELLTPAN
jgi:ABC-type glycerol-3-phosphate transport system substrate-binding protein